MKNREFYTGVIEKRFRIPIYAPWFVKYLWQPTFLKQWYYKKSYEWWSHPSNHHWKGNTTKSSRLEKGERCLWSGMYCTGQSETTNKKQ